MGTFHELTEQILSLEGGISSHLLWLKQNHLLLPKEFHVGCSVQILPSHYFEKVILKGLTPTPFSSIFVWRFCKRVSSCLHWSLVVCTVARSFSGPSGASEGLHLAGVADALDFFLKVLLMPFITVTHGWQDCFLGCFVDNQTINTSKDHRNFKVGFLSRQTFRDWMACHCSRRLNLSCQVNSHRFHFIDIWQYITQGGVFEKM